MAPLMTLTSCILVQLCCVSLAQSRVLHVSEYFNGALLVKRTDTDHDEAAFYLLANL